MITVGPLGWTSAAAVAWGASGRSAAGAGWLDCWATPEAEKATDRAETRRVSLKFITSLRVNHGGRRGLGRGNAVDIGQ